jgi:hypothetical protein
MYTSPTSSARGLSGNQGGLGGDKLKGEDALYYRFTSWDEQRRRRLELDRMMKERNEMSKCSFKPQVASNPYSDHVVKNSRGGRNAKDNTKHISERHADWMKQRLV